jgi:UDP-GlcNAc:undecaprenyl-phosphate GlcNAc-1-phosphate transferase
MAEAARLLGLPFCALVCLATALALSLYGTPLAARAALRFGIVDLPDGALKKHRGPTPYLGGLAVYGSFIMTMALVFDFDQRVLGLLLAGTILVLLGLVDDFGVLGVAPKFLGQAFATMVLIKSDIAIHIGMLPEWANLTLTVLWVVGITNAVNIIDIMDGLASGVAVIAAAFLLIVSCVNSDISIALMTATLMGSLLGFLRYNAYPARIFLGDTGSLFVGMMLGALAMIGKYDAVNSIGWLTPLLILAVPIFDTLYVMTLRVARGLNPFKGSPDHFALRLRRAGLPVPRVVALTWILAAAMGCLALLNLAIDERFSLMLVAGVTLALGTAGVALTRLGRAPAPAGEAVPGAAPTAHAVELHMLIDAPDPDVADMQERALVRQAQRNLERWRRR